MKPIDKVKLHRHSTIKEALEIINEGSLRIAVVCDGKKLVGVVADADLRRAFLKGLLLSDSIESITTRNPITAHVNDSSEKIIALASRHRVYEIPVLDDLGHVLGIEVVDELLAKKERSNPVVIMAGGLGTRLWPLTEEIPKPMLKVGGKPILETIIENFAKYGFKNIYLCVNYKSHKIEEYFKDGSGLSVSIYYAHEEMRLGTAGALDLLRTELTEPFFVMNGDLLTNVNFEHFFDFHYSQNADATMAVREYEHQVPYGVVEMKGAEIISIHEKPTYRHFVSAGMYLLSPSMLEYIPQKSYFDMPSLFEKLIEMKKNVLSFPVREYWLDIGRMSDFERANSEYGEVF